MSARSDEVEWAEKIHFFETASGNKVSKRAYLCSPQNLRLQGKTIIKPGAVVRGDLSPVSLGKFVIIEPNVVLRPCHKIYKGIFAYFPLTLGSFVTIGTDAIVSASSVGSYVKVEQGCVIGTRSVIHDCCHILPFSVIPADSVLPPFTIVGGSPGIVLGSLADSWMEECKYDCTTKYEAFRLK